jgi:hypothetical protein
VQAHLSLFLHAFACAVRHPPFHHIIPLNWHASVTSRIPFTIRSSPVRSSFFRASMCFSQFRRPMHADHFGFVCRCNIRFASLFPRVVISSASQYQTPHPWMVVHYKVVNI